MGFRSLSSRAQISRVLSGLNSVDTNWLSFKLFYTPNHSLVQSAELTNYFSLLSWQCPHLSVVISVPVTVTTCVSICPCACTSSIGGLLRALSTQTAFEEHVCSANHSINHRVQSPHVVLCDPIHLSWLHVM